MSAPSNTGGPQDPIAVVSMAREALRALKDAQVVESVTDSSHIASNVATEPLSQPLRANQQTPPTKVHVHSK